MRLPCVCLCVLSRRPGLLRQTDPILFTTYRRRQSTGGGLSERQHAHRDGLLARIFAEGDEALESRWYPGGHWLSPMSDRERRRADGRSVPVPALLQPADPVRLGRGFVRRRPLDQRRDDGGHPRRLREASDLPARAGGALYFFAPNDTDITSETSIAAMDPGRHLAPADGRPPRTGTRGSCSWARAHADHPSFWMRSDEPQRARR